MSFLQPHIYYFQVFGIPCLQFFFVDKLMKTVISQSLLKFELDSLKEIALYWTLSSLHLPNKEAPCYWKESGRSHMS